MARAFLKFGPKAKDPKKTARRLFRLMREGHTASLVIVAFCVVLTIASQLAGTLFLRTLIDDYILPMLASGLPDFPSLALALLKLAALFSIGIIASYATQCLMVNVSMDTLREIRKTMFAKMESLPITYFDTTSHGRVMSTFTNDTDTLQMLIRDGIVQIFSSALTVVSVFLCMLAISPILTAICLLFILLITAATKTIGKRSGANFRGQQKNLAAVNSCVEEMIGGQKVVKVFNHEEAAKKEFDLLNEKLETTSRRANSYANIMGPIMNNIGNLQYVVITLVGSALAIAGGFSLTLGMLATFLQMTRSFTMPFGQLANQMNSILMALAGAERVFALMDEESESDEGYVTLVNAVLSEDGSVTESREKTGHWAWKHPHGDGSPVTYTPLRGAIEMVDVTFGYESDKMVLRHLSLNAKPAEKIAFVGATGAGKTTITNLLTRFYDIQEGTIRFDGINITKIKKADLRRSLGLVLQDTHLFTGTIAENIRFGKPDAGDEEVIHAAKVAGAHGFIMMHPKGYETVITGDGEGLSQGQRQLLAIARAAIADPPVMILDEATSSIDTYTESLVQEGMDRLMEGRTVFVIAHRLSTVRNSQAILVLDHGEVIERGTHKELLEKNGVYHELYTGKVELS